MPTDNWFIKMCKSAWNSSKEYLDFTFTIIISSAFVMFIFVMFDMFDGKVEWSSYSDPEFITGGLSTGVLGIWFKWAFFGHGRTLRAKEEDAVELTKQVSDHNTQVIEDGLTETLDTYVDDDNAYEILKQYEIKVDNKINSVKKKDKEDREHWQQQKKYIIKYREYLHNKDETILEELTEASFNINTLGVKYIERSVQELEANGARRDSETRKKLTDSTTTRFLWSTIPTFFGIQGFMYFIYSISLDVESWDETALFRLITKVFTIAFNGTMGLRKGKVDYEKVTMAIQREVRKYYVKFFDSQDVKIKDYKIEKEG